jgi:hypothetical protein
LNILEVLTSINWKPEIGDPTAIGWIITVAYFVAAFFCWRAGLAEKKQGMVNGLNRNYWLWFGLATLLLVLGINKQLDLQTPLISMGRAIAEANGWYGIRREIQTAFVILASMLGFLLFFSLLWRLRRNWRQYWLVLLGLLFICIFILARSASFNHLDSFLKSLPAVGPFNKRNIVELGGLILIGAGAYYRRFKVKG